MVVVTSNSEAGDAALTVAALQISAGRDPSANLRLIGDAVRRAADRGADLVVAPEAAMACFGTRLADVAQPLDGPFADGLRALAQQHRVLLAAGMFTPAHAGKVHNTVLVTGADGEWTYDKIHLYDAFGARESDTVQAGNTVLTFAALGTTIGVATCYDLRFADQFSALGRAGAQLVIVPASWGDGPSKREQWDVLVRARAMDAQAYLLAADQSLPPDPAVAGGRAPLGVGASAVVDPLGSLLARAGSGPEVLVARIDLSVVPEVRARVPIFSSPG